MTLELARQKSHPKTLHLKVAGMCRHFPSHGDEAVTDTHPSMRLVMLTSDSNCHDKEYMTKRLTICMTKLRMNKSMFDES